MRSSKLKDSQLSLPFNENETVVIVIMVNHSDLSEWMTNDHNKFLGNSLVRRVPVICDGKDCFVIEVSFEPRMAESYRDDRGRAVRVSGLMPLFQTIPLLVGQLGSRFCRGSDRVKKNGLVPVFKRFPTLWVGQGQDPTSLVK